MKKLAYVILLMGALHSSAWAGVDDGLAAYQKGDYYTAFRELLPFAKAGDPKIQFIIGTMYANTQGVPKSDSDAVKWYQLAAAGGLADAQNNLAFMYANGTGVHISPPEAVKWWILAAHQGQINAQYNLGVMYQTGQGIAKNDIEAARWYQRAASQGSAKAKDQLRQMVDSGQVAMPAAVNLSSPQWQAEPLPDNRPTATQNATLMQYGGLIAFDRALHAEEAGDYATALKEWRALADAGHVKAQYRIGQMYRKGLGVNKDDTEARKWWQLAARQSDADAQTGLGDLYDSGEGALKSDSEAVKWYRLAADQGHANAQTKLGLKYATGRGVPKSDAEAIKWWRLAAKQGNTSAQLGLAAAYEAGIATMPQNKVVAYALYNLATISEASDKPASRNRDRLETELTVQQRQIAQSLSIQLQQSNDFLRTLDEAIRQTTRK